MTSPRRMERSCTTTTGGKRSLQADEEQQPDRKRPALASVIVEALKVDSLQKLCSSLEPILRKVVSEEVERALAKLGPARLNGRSLPKCIGGPSGRNLQLTFRSRLSLPLFTGAKVEGDHGAAIHIVLIDANNGHVITRGLESFVKLDVVVLEGSFNNEDDESWTREEFESHVVREREGKRPLLTGDMHVVLKEGVGTLGEVMFTDNSSWIRSRKFRLGLKIASGFCEGIRIREAKTEAFSVKDHRGELYRKHYPPALTDEVWRLEKIGKDGSFHKKLTAEGIVTVEDFLRFVVRDSQKLRNILGSGMSNKMWEILIEHAKTCVLSGKHYVYYRDNTRSIGVLFNNIFELSGFISGDQFLSANSLSERQKISVDSLVKKAYDNWNQVIEYDGKSLLSFSSPTSKNEFSSDFSYYPKTLSDLPHPAHQPSSVASEWSPVQHSLLVEGGGYDGDDSSGRYLGLSNEDGVIGFELAGGGSSEASNQSPPPFVGCEDFFCEEEIRIRSHEMLENEEIRQLLFWSMNGKPEEGGGGGFPVESFELGGRGGRSSGKASAGLGWLKIKAAMRWGFFVRRKAAEKRAQLQLQLIEIEDDDVY